MRRRRSRRASARENEKGTLSFLSLTDCGHRGQHLADVQLVEDRGLARGVEAEHDDLMEKEGRRKNKREVEVEFFFPFGQSTRRRGETLSFFPLG